MELDGLSTLWVLLAAFLVFFMQAGFGMVEAGLIRTKNAGNVIRMVPELMDKSHQVGGMDEQRCQQRRSEGTRLMLDPDVVPQTSIRTLG